MANKNKREYGTGSISKRKDGKWQGRVNLGTDINGKRKQKYFYGIFSDLDALHFGTLVPTGISTHGR